MSKELDMVRVEYKILQRGIDRVMRMDGSVDGEALGDLLMRYRVLCFGSRRNKDRVMRRWVHSIGYDGDRAVSSTTYYKRRAEGVARLERWMVDDRWMRDVEDVIVDHLSI